MCIFYFERNFHWKQFIYEDFSSVSFFCRLFYDLHCMCLSGMSSSVLHTANMCHLFFLFASNFSSKYMSLWISFIKRRNFHIFFIFLQHRWFYTHIPAIFHFILIHTINCTFDCFHNSYWNAHYIQTILYFYYVQY